MEVDTEGMEREEEVGGITSRRAEEADGRKWTLFEICCALTG